MELAKDLVNQLKLINKNKIAEMMESFIDFFGEQHRGTIENKINSTPIIFYLSNEENNETLKKYVEMVAQNYSPDGKEYYKKLIFSDLDEMQLSEIIGNMSNKFLIQSGHNPIYNVLFLPLNFSNSDYVHEIMHMLRSHVVRKEPLVLMNGISISEEKYPGNFNILYSEVDEVINQKMTRDVEHIQRESGYEFETKLSYQDSLFPLIDNFYSSHKDFLLEAGIIGDTKSILDFVNQDAFGDYHNLFFKCVWRLGRGKKIGEVMTTEIIDEANRIASNIGLNKGTAKK